MAIRFAVRGDSLDARFSNEGKVGIPRAARSSGLVGVPQVAADAGVLGGSKLDLKTSNAQWLDVEWPGRGNFSQNKAFSMLFRYKLENNFNFGQPRGIFFFSAFTNHMVGSLRLSSGNMLLIWPRFDNLTPSFNTTFGPTLGASGAGDEVDFFIRTSGLNRADLDLYIDGVLHGSVTWPHDNTSSDSGAGFGYLGVGQSTQLPIGDLVEMVIWDSREDVDAITLADDSVGTLDGESRTQFVKVSAFDALDFTNLDVSKVQAGQVYTAAGVAKTGTLDTIELKTDLLPASLVGGTLTGVLE